MVGKRKAKSVSRAGDYEGVYFQVVRRLAAWVKHHGALTVSIFACLLLLGGAAGWSYWYYKDHALPNVVVGNLQVGQLSEGEIRQAIQKQAEIKINLVDDKKQATAALLSDLGVKVDIESTVRSIMEARRQGDALENMQLWKTQKIPLSYTVDSAALRAYVAKNYPGLYIDAKDAYLQFNADSKKYDIIPGEDGRGHDSKWLQAALPGIMESPHTATLELSTAPVKPAVSAADLEFVQTEVNRRVAVTVQLLARGEAVYKISPDEIANWMTFTPDYLNKTVAVAFDKAKVQQLVDQTIVPRLTYSAIDKTVAVDQSTGAETVIRSGKDGVQVANAGQVVDGIFAALNDARSVDQEVVLAVLPAKTVTMSGAGKWIEVDLSSQSLALHLGDQVLQTFLISSGKPATPTLPGTFHIYSKLPMQTMTGTINGEYYYVPNIKWVSYFDSGRAFHGTYWHNNFGNPMSHGCVNMTEAAAKILYDFAPIGTMVVVHD